MNPRNGDGDQSIALDRLAESESAAFVQMLAEIALAVALENLRDEGRDVVDGDGDRHLTAGVV